MGKLAFIYPGQASQFVGMGADFFQKYPRAQAYYQQANSILGFDVTRISFAGPEEELKQTRITQPAIFVLSALITALLYEQGIKPQMVAGHSLGEYSALVAAGALSFEDALQIVKLRGELMQRAGDINPGTMAAIIGLTEDIVEEICVEVSLENIVQPANYNAPTQIVISGTQPGVTQAMKLAKEKGATKVVSLMVSGAFHSSLMNSAKDELRKALDSIVIKPAALPVYTNVTAEPILEAAQIRMALYKQITHPVRWFQSIQNMVGDGTEKFLEVGPGKVLTGLMRRYYREIPVSAVGDIPSFESLIQGN